MAYHKSAEKRAKQALVRRERNKSYVSGVKTAIKKFRKACEEMTAGKVKAEDAKALLANAQSALSKAASKGYLHKNNASRHISRLALTFDRLNKTV